MYTQLNKSSWECLPPPPPTRTTPPTMRVDCTRQARHLSSERYTWSPPMSQKLYLTAWKVLNSKIISKGMDFTDFVPGDVGSYPHLWSLTRLSLLNRFLLVPVYSTTTTCHLSFKGTVSPVYNYLKVIAFKSPWRRHMAPDIKYFLNCLFNF